jgi:hypothetical protein
MYRSAKGRLCGDEILQHSSHCTITIHGSIHTERSSSSLRLPINDLAVEQYRASSIFVFIGRLRNTITISAMTTQARSEPALE